MVKAESEVVMKEIPKRVKGAANHHLFKRGDKYWVRAVRVGKAPLNQSLFTENLTDARIARDNIMSAYLNKKLGYAGAKLVEDRFGAWLLHMEASTRKSTMVSIRNSWNNHLKAFFGELNLQDITEESWTQFVAWKRAQTVVRYGKTVSMANRKFFNDRKYLAMFLLWCVRQGYLDKVPVLKKVDPKIVKGKIFTDDEIERLFLHAEPNLHLQLLMGLTMGMRRGEILSLEWSQIDFKQGTIHLPALKTKINQERTFGISREVLPVLINRHERSNSPWVFPSPLDPTKQVGKDGNKSAWQSCRKAAKVSGRFHDTRHTFLTHAFKKAVNPALICKYAGLSLEEAQKTYLHFSTEDTRIVADLVTAL